MLTKVIEKRLKILIVLVIAIFVCLIARLSYLQLMHTQKYKTLSEQNRLRLIPVPAPRGEIMDRNGKPIAKDRPVYVVSIAYENDTQTNQMIDKLSGLLNLQPEDIQKLKDIVKQNKLPKYEPITVMKDVPIEMVTRIEERREELKNVMIDVQPQRVYLNGDFLSQVLGYTREISDTQLEANKDKGYKMGDRFGQSGLEKEYESYLKGTDGAHQVEVNNQGRVVNRLGIKEPVPGDNLILNIDSRLQSVAEQALNNAMASVQKEFPDAKAGAIVMEDVRTGKILAMASKPSYDANIFNGNLTQAQTDALFRTNPPAAINRVFSAYPPGSTYKMLLATAGLDTGAINESTTVFDPGYFVLDGQRYGCWGVHYTSNVIRALAVSCDTFFYNVGLWTKIQNIDKYGREYGFGQKTGVDLPDDVSGTLPSPEWKDKRYGPALKKKYDAIAEKITKKYDDKIKNAASEKDIKKFTTQKENELKQNEKNYKQEYGWAVAWQNYDTVITSIGQGYNQVTPLQLADYISTIANGGTRYKPYLVDRITDSNGKVVKQFEPEVMAKSSASPKTLDTVRRGMLAVTQGEGTATFLFQGWPIRVAAKTGTAETGPGKGNHGVFVAFAPYDNPQVAVAAIVEYGGHGGSSAGVATRDLMAAYFNIAVPGGAVYITE